ncbi:MAG: hypothetical protein ACD_41C00315G0004 [uncultured bacterium]|nr:MAG: hypothetical protein ACD_41C00315G0004 [uncultured bacterium]HBY74072.1 hypothetical protein [Candidatus Kerfeldbacteria bacterium]
MSYLNEPLHQVYPTLTADQQKAVRQLFMHRFRSDVGKLLRRLSEEQGLAAVQASVALQQQFIDRAIDPTPLLQELFTLAVRDQCNSVMSLCAQTLSTDLSIADEAAHEGKKAIRQVALERSGSMQAVIQAAFPEIDSQELLNAIRKDRGIIDEPRERRRPR